MSVVDAEQGFRERAVNLFTFLRRAQEMLLKPVRDVADYEEVLWFSDLPDHPAVTKYHDREVVESDDPFLAIDRVPRTTSPAAPESIDAWLNEPIDDPDDPPTLRDSINVDLPDAADSGDGDLVPTRTINLDEVPHVLQEFRSWLPSWQVWAERERHDREARSFYQDLFSVQLMSVDHAQEFEFRLGVGCLTWLPDDHPQVRRHLLTVPIVINLDESSGTLIVSTDESDEVDVELDMLDPHLITNPKGFEQLRRVAREYDGHALDRDLVGDLLRRLVNRLDAEGAYEDVVAPPTGPNPRAHFAPAIVVRKRTARGLVDIYHQIVDQLQHGGQIPDGVLPLIDPDRQPELLSEPEPGAAIEIADELYLPLPVNEKQRQIIQRVDRVAQTLVQGPPGTGKTHTAAALVSHLLAQGKRVLITAHTDRALYEVREKLPPAIQPLAVSVIGKSRSDMSELRLAVEQISAIAGDFDRADSERKIEKLHGHIDELCRSRAETYGRLLKSREAEVVKHEHAGEDLTLAAIAMEHARSDDHHGWISEYAVDAGEPCPLSDAEALEWLSLLRREDIDRADLPSPERLSALREMPTPAEFLSDVQRESAAADAIAGHSSVLSHEAFAFVSHLSADKRSELRDRVESLASEAMSLENRRESWMNEALTDIRTGRGSTWTTRRDEVLRLASVAAPLVERVGAEFSIKAPEEELPELYQQARILLTHLESGGKLKVTADGTARAGAMAPKPVKAAQRFLESVRINGLVPTSSEQVRLFVSWVDARRAIEAMDRTWPSTVVVPKEDTLREGLQWHRTEVEQLERVLALGTRIEAETEWFRGQKLPIPDWNDLPSIRVYADLVAAVLVSEDADAAKTPLAAIEGLIASEMRWQDAPDCLVAFEDAVKQRNVAAYEDAFAVLSSLRERTGAALRMEGLGANLMVTADRLISAASGSPNDEIWARKLGSLNAAWEWERTGQWILGQVTTDINVLQRQLDSIEVRLRKDVELLAAERAWGHAVSPSRLTAQARADLTQYAQLVSRLGKGTGKYAAKMRAEIKDAMRRCRPAVPVWIMPTYRIAEQLRIEPDLFDVVIVDEASQAGLESTFLQYLAPRMVVIGDDKQVSPSAVGVDQQKLRDLANQYLAGDRYIASWQDPKRSLFDEAKMRYGGLLTLTEHRRCVPEIIAFSNRIAYEPEGIRLIPVRQYGADRLEPIKVVHVTDGYEAGNQTNSPEADAIVDQVEKCLSDPAYDGVTFGIISMHGKSQAKLIEHRLMERIGTEEWTTRQIRCGDPTDFQGSERNVMFLSMIKSAEPGERLYALTKSDAVQRFNVAASRAKDQMWVYHSMPRAALTNKEDLRHQLLEYCYGVQARSDSDVEGSLATIVPEDVLIEPFDSLFEQRVANRILDRGYTVVPQYDAHGYRIDLVIVGPSRRLAVECDGDHWHGPDAYQLDLSRQRDLERCGWQFYRIRESVFYANTEDALSGLWDVLNEFDIHPADWTPPADLHDSAPPAEPASSDVFDPPQDPPPLQEVRPEAHGEGRHRAPPPPDHTLAPEAVTEFEPPDEVSLGAPEAVDAIVYQEHEQAGIADPGLPEYRTFAEPVPPVADLLVDELARQLTRVVETEGPVLGKRLHTAYVNASGGSRVGKEIARRLNRAISLAEGQGMIISDNPLAEAGIKPRIFRIPGQPEIVMRPPGPRSIEQIPVNELAAHLRAVGASVVQDGDEQLFRDVLDRLGLRRLTEHTRETLERAMEQVEGLN